MTMRVAESELNIASLQHLSELLGGTWRLVTGDRLPERGNSLFAFGAVVIAIEGREYTVRSELTVSDFEGYSEEYPQLSVERGAERLDDEIRSGRAFFRNKGDKVVAVYVVRDAISQLKDDETVWQYTTDIGIVIELTGGVVSVCKASHHTEALLVSFSGSLESVSVDDNLEEWEDELGVAHLSRREVLPLNDLYCPRRG